MRESLNIIEQALNYINILSINGDSSFTISDCKIVAPTKKYSKYSMESLIHHFKFNSEGYALCYEEAYCLIEAPKGEFGIFLRSKNKSRPNRCRIKAPGFLHLQGINMMAKDCLLADLVTIIGTQDLVFGEIDR